MKKRIFAALLFVMISISIMSTIAFADDTAAVYVSADGSAGAAGTQADPCATLADAVQNAPDGATIYVMTDLTMTDSARFWSKHLTITSLDPEAPVTIRRGEGMKTVSDTARSFYNPAMIEVQTSGSGASLTLSHIILDDCNLHEGTVFAQAVSGDARDDNRVFVQDAIVASNATESCTITLADGAVLRNFGGESAVRVTNAAQLVMQSGSVIEDTIDGLVRTKGSEEGETGPAGAVWLQGSSFTMNDGAEIRNIDGRAVYVDGGSATLGGKISNITGNKNMWQGFSGVALHIRNKGTAKLTATGKIDTITGEHASYRGAITTNGTNGGDAYDFEAEDGSVISNVTNFPTLYSNYGKELLNGTIDSCSNDFIIGGFMQNTTIGATGVIQNCVASKGAANAVVYTSNGSKIYLDGTVKDNTATYAFYIINQTGGGAVLTMNEGALISGTDGKNTGVYINASTSKFYMNGGEITGFDTGVYCRGKSNGRSATFMMEGGRITGNTSYAVKYAITGHSIVELNGGLVTGNSKSSGVQISASDGAACDAYEYIKLTDGVVVDDPTISLSFGTLTLDSDYSTVYLGRAADASIKPTIEALAAEADSEKEWSAKGSALYIKPTQDGSYHFLTTRGASVDKTTELYIGYIPIDADGKPEANCELTLIKLPYNAAKDLDVTMTDLTAGQAYAVMFINSNEKVKQYTVTFDLDGGEFSSSSLTPNPALVNEGDYLSGSYWTFPPKKDGWVFVGWYTVNEDGDLDTLWTKNDRVMGDMTLKARWSDCAVIFDRNDGSGQTENVEAVSGEALGDKMPDDPTRDGYTFTGWNTEPDGSGDTFTASTVVSGTMTVYAQWKKSSDEILPGVTGAILIAGLDTDDHIAYVYGYPDGTVRPDGTITRAEVTTIFYRLLTNARRDEIFTSENSFRDVDSSKWYNKAASSMAAGGYIQGYSDGTFGADKPITRAEFVAIASRFASKTTGFASYSDVDNGHWAARAIAVCASNGWVQGYEDRTFRPDQPITRAEAMTIINRMLGRGVSKGYICKGAVRYPDNEAGSWYYYEVLEATNDHEYRNARPFEQWIRTNILRSYDMDKYERP